MVKGKKPVKKEAGRKKKSTDKMNRSKNKSKAIDDIKKPHPTSLMGMAEGLKSIGGWRLGNPFSDSVAGIDNTFTTLIPNTKKPHDKAMRGLQTDMQRMLSVIERLEKQNNKMYGDILKIALTVSKLHVTGEKNLDLFGKIEIMLDEYTDANESRSIDNDTPDWA